MCWSYSPAGSRPGGGIRELPGQLGVGREGREALQRHLGAVDTLSQGAGAALQQVEGSLQHLKCWF